MVKRVLLTALIPMLALGAADAAVMGNAPAKQQLTYQVKHSKYGTIGTYTNTIERSGEMTNVTTQGKLSVTVLGINFYNQDISRKETWQGNRLMSFHGVTSENGKPVELDGKAEGDHFTLTTPAGATSAPADVRVANPWSREAIEGGMMLTPDRGRLEMISMSNMKTTEMLTIGRRQVKTEHVQVMREGGPRRYEVWLDEKGIPVQFAVVGNDTITFTLQG